MAATLAIGSVHTFDRQSYVFEQQYKIVAHVGGRKYEIELLPPSDKAIDEMFAHWAYAEERGWSTTPIWNKTWAECAEGERPQRVGAWSYEQMLERDLDEAQARAGQRMVVEMVGFTEWAAAF